MNKLQEFVNFCKKVQPQSRQDIERFFEGVIFFPYDNELGLQAFLFFNLKEYFPLCTELLLFEKSPNGKNTELGKCDFVYLTKDGRIALIETKFILTGSTGKTERTKRNEHRMKVFKQVISLKKEFSNIWGIPLDIIDCCIFTTEDLTHREEAGEIQTKHVSIATLSQWQQDQKKRLKTNVIVAPGLIESAKIPSTPKLSEIDELWMLYNSCDNCFQPEICASVRRCYLQPSDND